MALGLLSYVSVFDSDRHGRLCEHNDKGFFFFKKRKSLYHQRLYNMQEIIAVNSNSMVQNEIEPINASTNLIV